MSNPYAPDETPAQIFAEETWLQGALLSNIVYGVELTLFVMCFTTLARQLNSVNYKRQLALLTFVTVIFILGTLFMGAGAKFVQLAFIEDRNFPGGPGAFEEVMFSIPVDEMGNVSFIVGNWLMDAFLVWRFVVIYRECGIAWLWALALLPSVMLCASVALGITFLVQTSSSSPFADVNITLAYYVMSLALNVIVAIFIVGRLLLYRWRIVRVLGSRHESTYASVAAIMVESALLFAVFAILFLVPFGLNYPLGNVFLQTVSQVQTVSTLLIVFRLSTGKAWSEDTGARILTDLNSSSVPLRRLPSMRSSTAHSADFKDADGLEVSPEASHKQVDSNV